MDLDSLPGTELFAIWSALQHRHLQLIAETLVFLPAQRPALEVAMQALECSLRDIDGCIAAKSVDDIDSAARALIRREIERSTGAVAKLTALLDELRRTAPN